MRVIMTGGGTGGHIYPAIAIADKIRRKNPDADILFVGTERGLEKELVPKNGYPLRFITVSGFHRKQLWKNVKTFSDLMKGNRQAKKIIDEFRPDLVIGTGGYVCGPVVRAAHKRGVRTYIHEQNALPGVTNKMLENYVDKVFLSFPESSQHFRRKEKLVITGNPIRRVFLTADLVNYRKKLGIGEREFAVLCFGGSRGADKINSTMAEVAKSLSEMPDIRLFFVTGRMFYDKSVSLLHEMQVPLGDRIQVMAYADHMNEYLGAADLVVSRSGAITVAEITALGKASILIPSPNVTGNHQYFNAKVVADQGGSILIEEKDLTAERLLSSILKLSGNKEALNAMGKASASVGKKDAADVIYENLKP